MTTETLPHTPDPGVRVLLGALRSGVVGSGLVVAIAALTGSAADLRGAAIGAILTLAVLASGAFFVAYVARHLPAASLLVALVTYILEVAVLGLVFWRLDGSGALDRTLTGAWLGAAVMAATVGWLLGQVVHTMRARIPAYDLPETAAGARTEAGAP